MKRWNSFAISPRLSIIKFWTTKHHLEYHGISTWFPTIISLVRAILTHTWYLYIIVVGIYIYIVCIMFFSKTYKGLYVSIKKPPQDFTKLPHYFLARNFPTTPSTFHDHKKENVEPVVQTVPVTQPSGETWEKHPSSTMQSCNVRLSKRPLNNEQNSVSLGIWVRDIPQIKHCQKKPV